MCVSRQSVALRPRSTLAAILSTNLHGGWLLHIDNLTLQWINPRTAENNARQVSEQALSVLVSLRLKWMISSMMSRGNPIAPTHWYETHNPWRSTGVGSTMTAQRRSFLTAVVVRLTSISRELWFYTHEWMDLHADQNAKSSLGGPSKVKAKGGRWGRR